MGEGFLETLLFKQMSKLIQVNFAQFFAAQAFQGINVWNHY